MARTALKEWTDILTPWIQVIGLFAAGIFALVEYRENKDGLKTQRALTYLYQSYSDKMVTARIELSKREQEQGDRLRNILLDEKAPIDKTTAAYYNFVVDELIMHGKKEGLEAEFQITLGFLDEGVICIKEKLCDEATVRSSLWEYGRNFVRLYTPYLCHLRRIWKDPSIGQRVEQFYNPVPARDVCAEYYKAIDAAAPAPAVNRN